MNKEMNKEELIEKLANSLYIVNRNAKVAKTKDLYRLKKLALEKLIEEEKAFKIGLHYSNGKGNWQQKSDVVVQVGEYYFHLPAKKEDFKNLPHLGFRDKSFRNPKVFVPFSLAKKTLQQYVGLEEKSSSSQTNKDKLSFKKYPSYRDKNKYTPYFL